MKKKKAGKKRGKNPHIFVKSDGRKSFKRMPPVFSIQTQTVL